MIVKYRRLYPYAPYLNEEIGFERSIPDDSTDEQMIEAAIKLKEIADKAHQRINPEPIPTQPIYHSGPPPEIQVEKFDIGDIPAQIQTCKDLKALDSYKYIVRGKPELEKLYFDKLEELSK